MTRFAVTLKEHLPLIVTALIVLTVLGYYAWGIGVLQEAVQTATKTSAPSGTTVQFNVEEAKRIDFRGQTP
jgi:hypothetical protein